MVVSMLASVSVPACSVPAGPCIPLSCCIAIVHPSVFSCSMGAYDVGLMRGVPVYILAQVPSVCVPTDPDNRKAMYGILNVIPTDDAFCHVVALCVSLDRTAIFLEVVDNSSSVVFMFS